MEVNGEMISLSGNETVPMWAIAARTVGRVKETMTMIKEPVKNVVNYRSNTRSESSMNILLPFPRVFVLCLVCVASPPPFQPTILAPP